jgi:hypothetical protein
LQLADEIARVDHLIEGLERARDGIAAMLRGDPVLAWFEGVRVAPHGELRETYDKEAGHLCRSCTAPCCGIDRFVPRVWHVARWATMTSEAFPRARSIAAPACYFLGERGCTLSDALRPTLCTATVHSCDRFSENLSRTILDRTEALSVMPRLVEDALHAWIDASYTLFIGERAFAPSVRLEDLAPAIDRNSEISFRPRVAGDVHLQHRPVDAKLAESAHFAHKRQAALSAVGARVDDSPIRALLDIEAGKMQDAQRAHTRTHCASCDVIAGHDAPLPGDPAFEPFRSALLRTRIADRKTLGPCLFLNCAGRHGFDMDDDFVFATPAPETAALGKCPMLEDTCTLPWQRRVAKCHPSGCMAGHDATELTWRKERLAALANLLRTIGLATHPPRLARRALAILQGDEGMFREP